MVLRMKRPCREVSFSDPESNVTINVGKEEGCSQMPRSASPTTTSQVQARKKRRGIIEKRRRDRINSSLSELRCLVPTAIEKQGSSKLEKAEILQMTVDHLKMLRATGSMGLFDAQALAVDYRSLGFRECLTEVVRYLGILEGQSSSHPLRLRLLSHLNNYVAEMEPLPGAASLLPLQPWPWHLLPECTAPPAPGRMHRKERGPGWAAVAASPAYPRPTLRAAPTCRIPTAAVPVYPNVLTRRIASSRRSRPPLVTLTASRSASGESLREAAARSSQVATFLFSSASSSARVAVTPVYIAPTLLDPPAQGPGISGGTAGLCHSWTAEIGAS